MTPNMTGASRDENITSRAFLRGLGVIAFLYALIFSSAAFQSQKTMTMLEEKFPFKVALIEHAPPPAPPPELFGPPVPVITPIEAAPVPDAQVAEQAPVEAQPTEEHKTAEHEVAVDVPLGPLKPAPFEGLYESNVSGMLPKIAPDGLTPFDAYKRPFSYRGAPVVSIAIRDFGLSAKASDLALALPPEVTLILSPYAQDIDLWQKKAREAGHEVWLYLPMQNQRFLSEDPGAGALLVNSALTVNMAKMDKMLGQTTGYAGVISETDKAFLDMHSMLSQIVETLFSRGLAYAETNPAGSGLIETIAVRRGSPFIGIPNNNEVINENDLQRMESLARDNGYHVNMVTLTPANVEAIKIWTLGLESRGVGMAPLSAIAAGRVPKKSAPRSTSAPISHE